MITESIAATCSYDLASDKVEVLEIYLRCDEAGRRVMVREGLRMLAGRPARPAPLLVAEAASIRRKLRHGQKGDGVVVPLHPAAR